MHPRCTLTTVFPVNTPLRQYGVQVCSKISRAVYERLGTLTRCSYHPITNGGIERINHTMAQVLTMVVNEQ